MTTLLDGKLDHGSIGNSICVHPGWAFTNCYTCVKTHNICANGFPGEDLLTNYVKTNLSPLQFAYRF